MTVPAEQRTSAPTRPDETITCVVEIPKGSRNKYEYDHDLGTIKAVRAGRDRDAALLEIEQSRMRYCMRYCTNGSPD
jgi:inorganic pyrophosphatase